jgi:hypothetical protein
MILNNRLFRVLLIFIIILGYGFIDMFIGYQNGVYATQDHQLDTMIQNCIKKENPPHHAN